MSSIVPYHLKLLQRDVLNQRKNETVDWFSYKSFISSVIIEKRDKAVLAT
jgi:hypothetical protein